MLALPGASSLFKDLKVFIAGGPGQTGRRIVQRLVAEGVPVRALVRNRLAAVRADLLCQSPSSIPLELRRIGMGCHLTGLCFVDGE